MRVPHISCESASCIFLATRAARVGLNLSLLPPNVTIRRRASAIKLEQAVWAKESALNFGNRHSDEVAS